MAAGGNLDGVHGEHLSLGKEPVTSPGLRALCEGWPCS